MHWRDTLTKAIVTVDLKDVCDNASRVDSRLPGSEVVARTKVTRGSPEVGAAMLAGAAIALGELRLQNAERLPAAGVTARILLPRALASELVGWSIRRCTCTSPVQVCVMERRHPASMSRASVSCFGATPARRPRRCAGAFRGAKVK
jgi:hypothetical protein